LNAQVKRYEGVVIKNEKGEDFVPVKNDMDALHELTSAKLVDFAQRIVFNREGVEVINFGKHAGKPIVQVLKDEPSYYDWMMKGDFPLDTKRKLTEIKLRAFNNR
jgi:DNA polymerase-3 subunit epsilon